MILNEEMEDIMKIGKSLWRIWFTKKRCKWNKKEQKEVKAKERKAGFLSVLLGTLAASLLGNLLTGYGTLRAGEGTIRAGQNLNMATSFNYFWNTKVLCKRSKI